MKTGTVASSSSSSSSFLSGIIVGLFGSLIIVARKSFDVNYSRLWRRSRKGGEEKEERRRGFRGKREDDDAGTSSSNGFDDDESDERQKQRRSKSKRRLLAVSGTLQDGFALRKNLDGENEGDEAIFIGHALVRGVKMYFDVKPEGCREHVGGGERPKLNPCLVPTNDWNDGNVYHVFAVTEEALVEALANEPRYLGIAPDVAKVDLRAKETSESVRVAAGGCVDINDENRRYGVMLTVVAYGIPGARAVEAKGYVKDDGCRVTTFAECSAASFGEEKTPFTTRDANICKARERREDNIDREDHKDQHNNNGYIFCLREDMYGARSVETPRLIRRDAAERAIAYVQNNKAIDGGYFPPSSPSSGLK
jgi:hypothetical protein